jgi:hypothetical protein
MQSCHTFWISVEHPLRCQPLVPGTKFLYSRNKIFQRILNEDSRSSGRSEHRSAEGGERREKMKPDTIIDILLLIVGIFSLLVLIGVIFYFS